MSNDNMPGEPAPSNVLFGLVGLGMRAYVRAAFRLHILGAENAPLRPGMLIVATHRSDHDVPLVASLLYLEGRAWRGPARMHFASRDDLFQRGALAGLAAAAPRPLVRALWRVAPAGGLARVRVHPLGRADLAAPAQALRAVGPGTPLDAVLPARLVRRLADRAELRGTAAPTTAAEALRPDFADLLFTAVGPEELDSPMLNDFWSGRGRDAATHLRRLADLVRAGRPLVVFPEGGLSPDGGIGPVRRGFGVLARAARPSAILPVALAYDGLVAGRRPRLVAAVGPAFTPAAREEEAAVLRALRRLMPLTCGQVIAEAVAGACLRRESELVVEHLDGRLATQVAIAEADRRPVDPALSTEAARRRRLAAGLRALEKRGVAIPRGAGRLGLDPAKAADDVMVQRLAREYESARENNVSSR